MGQGCPICNISKGEYRVINFLEKNNIKYIRQYSFNNCKYIKKLQFDFYLKDYNLLIEFDGKQHFTKKSLFIRTIEDFKERQRLDEIKTNYCKENNINLLRIPYTEIDNIESILKDNIYKYDMWNKIRANLPRNIPGTYIYETGDGNSLKLANAPTGSGLRRY